MSQDNKKHTQHMCSPAGTMTEASAHITVGCFGAPEEQLDLQHSLVRVGYQPDFINVLNEFTAATDHGFGTFVLFCGSSACTPKQLRAVSDACPLQPAMTILGMCFGVSFGVRPA